MKSIRLILPALLLYFAATQTATAQGWVQNRKAVLSVGVGATQAIMIANPYPYPAIYGGGFSMNFSAEWRVHRFVGVGLQTGVNILFGPPYRRDLYPRYTAIGIPLAMKVNVHILEAANNKHADKLDVYAGLNVGGGPAFYTAPFPPGPPFPAFGFIQAGPQIGVRYWLSPQIGLFGELGWGATFANFGLSF